MTVYTVNSGDNLWTICKKQFNLSSNTEIANKVREIVSRNNLKNGGNTIFVGQKIDIGDTNTTSPIEKKEYSQEINNAVAQKIALNNVNTEEDFSTLAQSSVSIFGADVNTNEEKNVAYFDYSEKLLLDYYDESKDGIITVEEFAKREQISAESASSYDTSLSPEEKSLYATIAQRCGNLFAQNLDFNNNGNIDAEELAFFNKFADGLDGDYDGVIKAKSESAMFNSITGLNADNQEYKRVINKYLKGESLTPEEEAVLKESQQVIRRNLSKASGINIEG